MEDKTFYCVLYDNNGKKYAAGLEYLVENGIEYTIKTAISCNQAVFRLKPKQIRAMAEKLGSGEPHVVM